MAPTTDLPVGTTGLDESRQAREQMDQGSLFWTPKAGQNKFEDNFVRVLPPHVNMGRKFYEPVAVHFLRLGDAQRYVFVCPRGPRGSLGGNCPACQEGFRLYRAGSKDAARTFWPSVQGYVNVVVLNRDGTPAEEKPRVWAAKRDVIDQLIAHMEDPEIGDFTSLEEGRDLRVRRKDTKQGEWTQSEYMILPSPKQTDFDYPDIVRQLHDLSEMARPQTSADEIHRMITEPASSGDPLAEAESGEERPALVEGQAREVPAEEGDGQSDDPWGDAPETKDEVAQVRIGGEDDPPKAGKPRKSKSTKTKRDPQEAEDARARLRQQLKS